MARDIETAVEAVEAFVQRWESRIGTGAQTGDTIYCVTVNGFEGEAELRASDIRLILSANREMREREEVLRGALERARRFVNECAVQGELTPSEAAENPCEVVNAIDQAAAKGAKQ